MKLEPLRLSADEVVPSVMKESEEEDEFVRSTADEDQEEEKEYEDGGGGGRCSLQIVHQRYPPAAAAPFVARPGM